MVNKETDSVTTETKDSKKALKSLNGIKKLKTLDVNQSNDFMCDIETGICGPVTQKEEGKR